MFKATSPSRRSLIALTASGVCIWLPGSVVFGLIGLLMPIWALLFNAGRGALGLTVTSLLASVGVFMYFSGRWSDRVGARLVAALGSAVVAGSLLLISYAPSLYLLYLAAFILGAGTSLVYIPAVSSAQRWLPSRRGLASGIVSTLYGISGSAMIPVFRYLLVSHGYVVSLAVVAMLVAAIGVASAQLMEFPEKLGYAISSASSAARARPSRPLSEALRTRVLWLTWLTWALCGGAGMGMVTFSTSISLELGLDEATAAACLAAFNVTNGLSRLVSGALSDRLGRSVVMAGFYMASAAGFLILATKLSEPWVVLLSNLLAGLCLGTVFAVSAPYLMDHFGPAHFGSIFGFTFTAYGFVGSWLGPFIGGLLRDLSGTFVTTCSTFAAYVALSAVAILIAGDVKRAKLG
ncbi:MAG: MFS transporter [Candidatus Nezhaarchaeota archaeon]|nr:MFS transporter [Candidatus Nezhaarchaeota archaeon]